MSRYLSSQAWRGRFALGLLALWWVGHAVRAQAAGFWSLQPYRALFLLEDDGSAAVDFPELADVLEDWARSTSAEVWRVEVRVTAPWRPPARYAHLPSTEWDNRAPEAALPSRTLPSAGQVRLPSAWLEFDKVVVIKLRKQGAAYAVQAREFDVPTRTWAAPQAATVLQQRAIPFAMQQAIVTAHAPLVQFRRDGSTPDEVALDPKAAALAGHPLETTGPEDVFLPIIRRNDREGQPRAGGVNPVPWTYLQPLEMTAEEIRCEVVSGTRRPLGARRLSRSEEYALRVRPLHPATELQLRLRGDTNLPLAGCQVHERNVSAEGKPGFKLLGTSDDQGSVLIPKGKLPLRVLWLKSGTQIIARLPLVPGERQELTVPVPDDRQRLQAEGELAALREELIDLVAQRNILIARIEGRVAAGDFPTARELLEVLQGLPTRARFAQMLRDRQAELRSRDPETQARIDRLFGNTAQVLTAFLDTRPVDEIAAKVRGTGSP